MEWWPVTAGIGALGLLAVLRPSHLLSVLTLLTFLPLALYTLYRDFDRFWVLMVLALGVLAAALLRAAKRTPQAAPWAVKAATDL